MNDKIKHLLKDKHHTKLTHTHIRAPECVHFIRPLHDLFCLPCQQNTYVSERFLFEWIKRLDMTFGYDRFVQCDFFLSFYFFHACLRVCPVYDACVCVCILQDNCSVCALYIGSETILQHHTIHKQTANDYFTYFLFSFSSFVFSLSLSGTVVTITLLLLFDD